MLGEVCLYSCVLHGGKMNFNQHALRLGQQLNTQSLWQQLLNFLTLVYPNS